MTSHLVKGSGVKSSEVGAGLRASKKHSSCFKIKINHFLIYYLQILCSAWNWKRPTSGDNYECVGLGFPAEDLRTMNFIRDDSVILKLTVYLD